MRRSTMTGLAGALVLTGCGGGTEASGPALSVLAQQGKSVFNQCSACHSIAAGEPHRSGPNLHGVVGAPIGSRDGYNYSPALANADGVWTEDRLDAWLENPKGDLAGHKMAFGGLSNAEERTAVITYLNEASQDSASGNAPTE